MERAFPREREWKTMVKKKEAWAAVTEAAHFVSPKIRTVAQLKKKWFDI